ncbi:MAG: fatty acid cis/trans isomerase, partial [Desulfofustis sp.]
YFPEASDLTCAENEKELDTYLRKHPNSGMPFGFPPLTRKEFSTVAGWLMQGAVGPSAEQRERLRSIDAQDQAMVDSWEAFLNSADPKHRMTARYLYEHLFLAHITFKTGSNEFYEMVRSRTGPGREIDIIATVRPYDDPGTENFYYRFRKIYSTIVHKTHMVFTLDTEQLERVKELFISPPWHGQPRLADYDKLSSANPFVTFEQIPPRSRYQWLLDNAHYVIMTYIRGPVCKGQVALNVINDHFWVMFLDPDYDLSVRFPGFLKLQADNLRLPSEKGSDYNVLKTLIKNEHYKWAVDYYQARQSFYAAVYPDGLDAASIWPGRRPDDAPLLTVFRHFDSASVHRGVLGNLPKTAWVIDYPLFERIYYSLVAGFDIYGTVGHQLATRFYMDALRIEGESYFLDYMPENIRKPMMYSWYIGIDEKDLHYYPAPIPAKTLFTTDSPRRELMEQVVDEVIVVDGIDFDTNYIAVGKNQPPLPQRYDSLADVVAGFIATSAPGVSFFRHVSDHNANVAWVRITDIPGRDDAVVSVVVDRWHDNVRFLFREKNTLDPSKDGADFIPGFVGSYPNYFFVVAAADIPDFFDILDNYDGSDRYIAKLEKYGINRAEPEFWQHYDWFQEKFNASDPVHAGLVDLNRYFYLAFEQ